MAIENTHIERGKIKEILSLAESVFFIGIGGINMSSLAVMTKRAGLRVGGSDIQRSPLTEELESMGIEVFYGHDEKNLEGYGAVVYTVAISGENPEYLRAAERGIPLISRADYLGYVMMASRYRIGVSGMHGKSTTTSMIADILMGAGLDPVVMCGARMPSINSACYIGEGEDFLFEACEYMDSFLNFCPNIAVILNVEPEHLDYFKDLDHICNSFCAFSDICAPEGVTVLNADDKNSQRIAKRTKSRVFTFGIENEANVMAVNIESVKGRYSFDVTVDGDFYCHTELSVEGRYNVYNALAALAVSKIRGIDGSAASGALRSFTGAERRMERKGYLCGAEVFSDYAHHPTEITAALNSAREMTDGRVVCMFQPHTYSRARAFLDETCRALSLADRVIMIDVYAAREVDTLGVSSALIAEMIGEKATYCKSYADAEALLRGELSYGDMFIVMGAGSIITFFDEIKLDS